MKLEKELLRKVVLFFVFIIVVLGLLTPAGIVKADPEPTAKIRVAGPTTWKYKSPVVTVEDRARGFVIVRGGWTLGGIAKALYGSHDVTRLLKYNNIEDINVIHVGQKIWLRPKVVLTDKERASAARVAVWKRMKKSFYYRTRVEDYPVTATREWAHGPLNMVQLSTSGLDLKQYFREVLRRTEWVDILDAYNTMVEVTDTPEELLRLAGLMWQESSFKNVTGKHGEIGFGQILPETGLEILKNNPDLVPEIDVDFLTVEDVRDMLKVVSFNVKMAHVHLKGLSKNKTKALQKYNGFGPTTIVYAEKVQGKIDRLKKDWNKEINKLYQERLKEIE